MFDVFYSGIKPNLFAHEQSATNIEHARKLSRTRYFWWINYLTDYNDHDFLWEPVPWQADQTHVWPSQHQVNGGTMLVPKSGGAEVNREHAVLPRIRSVPCIGIDHGNGIDDVACETTTRYISDYLGTLRRILKQVPHEYVWVVSSVCDYKNFDFTWHPSEWQTDMLHVFASGDQKFGDTFYIHVPSFLEKIAHLKILEWFETLNFVSGISVPRVVPPAIQYSGDSLVMPIWNHDFRTPVVQFYKHTLVQHPPALNLWQNQTKNIVPLTTDNSTAMVPRECKNFINKQIYDYPYLDKTQRNQYPGQSQDIVYISYDEPEAEQNYQKLIGKYPRAKRVHGVQGMENALMAAADVSHTPWYFAVFAKTQLADTFKFDFVPDYFQDPKHYIFNCVNRVNGLTYGHMGIILYNCTMVKNAGQYDTLGLDYTLSFPHEVVPETSCIGAFDVTPYHTWRTAFRECAKLSYFNSIQSSPDNEYRLKIWTTRAHGVNADWCLKGARDGIEFFKETQGNLMALKQSFRWQWLREYFVARHGELD